MKLYSHVLRKWLTAIFTNLAITAIFALAISPAAHAQQNFATPEAAMNAFGEAIVKDREDALRTILGKDFRNLIPPVGAQVRDAFLTMWSKSHAIKPIDTRHAEIAVGDDGWTLPIPLVKTDRGWHFDTRAGAE